MEQCRRTGAAVSLLPVGCRVSAEASDPLTTPAPKTQGEGGEGEGRVRGCCLSSSKVNGCHGPANGDGEPTVNLTLPVRVLCGVGGSGGGVARRLDEFTLTDRSPLLLLSVCRPSSLSLSSSLAVVPSLPSVCDLGAGSEGKTQLHQGRGVRAGRERARSGGSPHKFALPDSALGRGLVAASGGSEQRGGK